MSQQRKAYLEQAGSAYRKAKSRTNDIVKLGHEQNRVLVLFLQCVSLLSPRVKAWPGLVPCGPNCSTDGRSLGAGIMSDGLTPSSSHISRSLPSVTRVRGSKAAAMPVYFCSAVSASMRSAQRNPARACLSMRDLTSDPHGALHIAILVQLA